MGLLIRAEALPRLFTHAGAALMSVITDRRRVRGREERSLAVEAPDLEGLMVQWLQELIYLFETRGLLFRDFQAEIFHKHKARLEGLGRGEPYDPSRHPIKTLVKGVTYHQLEIRREARGWRARIILDL